MVAGMGVQIENTIPFLVEKHLNRYNFPVKIEALNMAVGTESTNGQIVTYEEIGTKYDADLVICNFMDDFGDNVLELSKNRHAPYFRIDENNKLLNIGDVFEFQLPTVGYNYDEGLNLKKGTILIMQLFIEYLEERKEVKSDVRLTFEITMGPVFFINAEAGQDTGTE